MQLSPLAGVTEQWRHGAAANGVCSGDDGGVCSGDDGDDLMLALASQIVSERGGCHASRPAPGGRLPVPVADVADVAERQYRLCRGRIGPAWRSRTLAVLATGDGEDAGARAVRR